MMVKEIEKSGMPIVHMVSMTPVALSIGSNRIVKSYGVSAPMCDPEAPEEVQFKQRYDLLVKALKALCTDISQQTVF